MVDALVAVGIEGTERVVGVTQGWKLSGSIKTTERKLADGTLRHAGQRLMNWAAGNARVEPEGNAITITKRRDQRKSIRLWQRSMPLRSRPNPLVRGCIR